MCVSVCVERNFGEEGRASFLRNACVCVRGGEGVRETLKILLLRLSEGIQWEIDAGRRIAGRFCTLWDGSSFYFEQWQEKELY